MIKDEKNNIITHSAIGASLNDKITALCNSTDRTVSYITREALQNMFNPSKRNGINKNWAFRESGNVVLKKHIESVEIIYIKNFVTK